MSRLVVVNLRYAANCNIITVGFTTKHVLIQNSTQATENLGLSSETATEGRA